LTYEDFGSVLIAESGQTGVGKGDARRAAPEHPTGAPPEDSDCGPQTALRDAAISANKDWRRLGSATTQPPDRYLHRVILNEACLGPHELYPWGKRSEGSAFCNCPSWREYERIVKQLPSCGYAEEFIGVTDAGEAIIRVPKSQYVEKGCRSQGKWLFNLHEGTVRRMK
jgi:hypothetical protein